MLSSYSREALKKVSTATLTTVLFKRGFRNVFLQGIFLLNRDAPRMVGEAFTLRYIPAREDIDQLGAFEGRGHPQREAIEACPPGQVLVMDARRASMASPVSTSHAARPEPIRRGSNAASTTDGMPSFTSGMENLVPSAATRRSQAAAISRPAPITAPCKRATTGTGRSRITLQT